MVKNKKNIRLSKDVVPVKYDLTIKPDLESFNFWGKEIIDIVLGKDTKEITLHSKDIDIETAEIKINKDLYFAKVISYDEKSETATLHFKDKIKKGKVKITLVFTGIISDNLRGFYKSKYEINGITKHIATTQFEATDARRAFPCFDEPAQKAIFDVSFIIPGTHTAISNTLPKSIKEHEAGYKIVSFESTPKMSTYLLAFIIGDFEYVEDSIKGKGKSKDVKIRVYTTAGKKHQAKFALDVAKRCLHFYNEYFDIPYPLPTLDLIAIPDFESAAMENWGAITFRETALLFDEEKTSLANKQWIAIVIAHEIAHQWFGNLVTMHWWTDLWLNEGFASYMENLCVDHIFPEWKLWDLYLADRYQVALKLDALQNSHPIEVPVHHPDEISEIFDMISYAKGSAVIRMLAEYIGYKNFRDGLRHYLKKHSYKNTKTTDLWESFEKVSKKEIVKMMNTWTLQTGYPLLSLSKKSDKYTIDQERFFSSRISRESFKKSGVKNKLWHIPFSYETNGTIKNTILLKKNLVLEEKEIGKLNLEEKSFIRTNYDNETIARLKNEIIENKLSVKDRLGLARDVFALAESGYIDATVALDFSLAYKNEEEYIVWSELSSGINKIYSLFREDKYKDYALSLFSSLAQRLGWENKKGEEHSQTFLRSLAISLAGAYGDKDIIKKAQKLFKDRNKNPIRADIRSTVYGIVAQNGTEKDWSVFKKLYASETMHEEKDRMGRALTLFKDKKILEKTLAFAISKDVRTQDAPFIIGSVWTNYYGRDITWKFIKKNYKEILQKYGTGGHFLSRILSPLGVHNTKKDADDIEKFFKKNSAPGSARTIEQSLERIKSNVAWIESDKKTIKQWLNKNY